MQSAYVGYYTRVLEVAHPGNKAWNDLLWSFATGCNDLTPSLQGQVRLSMLILQDKNIDDS